MSEQPPSATDTTTPVINEPFGYSGKTSEYFRIWIVSLCLTILTLGIYSAWAKVRKRRYLYRSTHLAGASFDYHADPLVLLKGRLIAFGLLAIYVATGYFAPGVDALIGLAIVIAIPWLIVRARMFNARYTSYRNLRFRFDPVYGKAYEVVFLYGFLTAITLGVAYPYAQYRRSRMIVDNSHFGNLDFDLGQIGSDYFAIYVKTWIIAGAAIVGFIVLLIAIPTGSGEEGGSVSAGLTMIPFVTLVFVFILISSYLGPATSKLVYGNTAIGDHRLRCDWHVPTVMFIYMTNLLAIALTLGLAIPWATIRLQRYQYEHLSLDVRGNLDAVIAQQSDEVSALGDEIGEAFDIDIGL